MLIPLYGFKHSWCAHPREALIALPDKALSLFRPPVAYTSLSDLFMR